MPRDPDAVNRPPPDRPDPLARALGQLDPAPAELNRDALMFQAGAESRNSVIRLWQLTAGFMTAVGFAAGAYYRSTLPEVAPAVSPATTRSPDLTITPPPPLR